MRKQGRPEGPAGVPSSEQDSLGSVDRLYSFLEESEASYISMLQKKDNPQNEEWSLYNEVCHPNRAPEETLIAREEEPVMSELADSQHGT